MVPPPQPPLPPQKQQDTVKEDTSNESELNASDFNYDDVNLSKNVKDSASSETPSNDVPAQSSNQGESTQAVVNDEEVRVNEGSVETEDEDKDTTDHNQQQALLDSKGDPNIDEDEEDRQVTYSRIV